jgi:hypothetical protein
LIYLKFPPSGGFAQVANRPRYLSKLELQEISKLQHTRVNQVAFHLSFSVWFHFPVVSLNHVGGIITPN